jgi:hypothetical protein
LSGKIQALQSVSVNLSYRITLELLIQDEQIISVNVGDHDAVYCDFTLCKSMDGVGAIFALR